MAKTAILSVRITSDADSKGFRKAVREIKAFEKNAKKSDSTLARFSKGLRSLGASATRFAKNASLMATKASALTTAIGGVAAPLAAIGAVAAQTIVPIAGLTAAMAPAAIGAAAIAITTLKKAFSGFGGALAATDPAAFAEAIAQMPPAAQSAVTALKGIKDAFTDIGSAIQQSFWDNVSNIGDLETLVKPIGTAMTGLAVDMGNALAGLVKFVSAGTGLEAMQSLISNSSEAAANLSYAFADVARGIISAGAAAAPVFAEISSKLATIAAAWADSMQQGFETGALQAFFSDAVDKAQALFTVLGQLKGILSGVFAAMSAAGMPFLGTIGQIIAATNDWVNSAHGLSTMQSIFSALATAVAAVLPIVGQLAGIIGGTLAPAFAGLVTTIAPVVGQLVTAFSGILSAIMPIVPIIGQLAATFGGVLASALTAITPIFSQLAQIIGGALTQAMQLLAPLFPILVAAFQQLAAGLTPLMPAVQSLVTAFIGLLPPIVQLASGLLPGLVNIILALVPVISAIIQGVANFATSLQPLISLVAALAGPVLGALAAILRVVASAIAPVIQLVVTLALQVMAGTKAFGAIKSAIGAVRGAISGAVAAFSTVKAAIQSVIGTVSALIGALASISWPSPPAWFGKVFGEDATLTMPTLTPALPRLVTGVPRPPVMLHAANGITGSSGTAPAVAHAGSAGDVVVNITVNGAIDSRQTAEQIRKILRDDARTRGLTTAGGYGLWR